MDEEIIQAAQDEMLQTLQGLPFVDTEDMVVDIDDHMVSIAYTVHLSWSRDDFEEFYL